MKLSLIFKILIVIFSTNLYGQNNDIQAFGNELGKAISENDSILFKSLIIPKEAIIEKMRTDLGPKLDQKELNKYLENINSNYQGLVDSEYMFSFFNLTTQNGIFKFNLQDLNYKIVEVKDIPDDFSIMPIHGVINHDTYKHFTFFLTSYREKLYLASHLIQISDVNRFDEMEELKKVTLSADEKGNLICEGRILLASNTAPKKEVLDCILSSPITIGVYDHSTINENGSDVDFVKGKWQYSYYIKDGEMPAGTVEFKYQFNISNGQIDYVYYDFIHSKDDSDYKSIGQLSYEFNDEISKVFTKTEYEEITSEIYLNQRLAVRRTKRYTDKCFN